MIESIIEYRTSIRTYVVGILLAVLLAYIYDCRKKKIGSVRRFLYFVLISCPYSFIVGYRGAEVGYDTSTYVYMYENISNDSYNEILFKYILILFHKLGFTKNYGPAFTAIAFITIITFIYAVYLYDNKASIALSVFLYYMFYSNVISDQMRQVAAVSILILCIVNIYRKKYIMAAILGMTACMMHTSALMGLLVLLMIMLLKLNKEIIIRIDVIRMYLNMRLLLFIVLLAVFIICGFGVVANILLLIIPQRYFSYFSTRIDIQNVGLGMISDILPTYVMLFLGFGKNKNKKDSSLYAYGCYSIIFRLLGYYSYFVARMAYFPNILSILMIPSYINIYAKNKKIWKILVVLICIWYYLTFAVYRNQRGTFPYYTLMNEL